jgi:hypothetical protein
MAAGRMVALLFGLIAIGLGANGVRVGKVLTKAIRPPWPGYFFRNKEPVAFWMTVGLWIALGTFIVAAVLLPNVFGRIIRR